jgi:hypothetical protein
MGSISWTLILDLGRISTPRAPRPRWRTNLSPPMTRQDGATSRRSNHQRRPAQLVSVLAPVANPERGPVGGPSPRVRGTG